MMKKIISKITLFALISTIYGCSNPKKRPVDNSSIPAIERHQKKLKSFYDNSKTTPLSKEEKRSFEGIHFFPIDTTYIVKAHFERLENQEKFKMPTTGENETLYMRFTKISFELNNKYNEMTVYQNLDLATDEGYAECLFLSFLDETNGEE